MPIFYALVSRKTTVLAEFTGRTGNFPTVTRTLLTKITDGDSKMSYVYDKCVLFLFPFPSAWIPAA
jgi:vesicle-associated membrane protein 7